MPKLSTQFKACKKCKKLKSVSAFHKDKTTATGFNSWCKKCKLKHDGLRSRSRRSPKEYQDRYRYAKLGMTLENYNKMLTAQNDRCKICNRHKSDQKRSLHVDHCHDSGKIRGILCGNCNVALGLFNDDIDTLKKAIIYLKQA